MGSLCFLGRPGPLFGDGASTAGSTSRTSSGQSRSFSGGGATTSGSVGGALKGRPRPLFDAGALKIE
jgi:hypothetical protein